MRRNSTKEDWLKGGEPGESAHAQYQRMARGEFKSDQEREDYRAEMARHGCGIDGKPLKRSAR